MKLFILSISSFFVIHVSAQKKVSLDELKNNAGEIVEVRGKVTEISKLAEGKEQQAVIYVGGVKPKEKLTIVIKKIVVGKTDYFLTDKKYRQGVVIAKGRVLLQEGRPQIVIDSADELTFIIDEEVFN